MALIRECDRCGKRMPALTSTADAWRCRLGNTRNSHDSDLDLCATCGLAVKQFATTPPPQARR